MIYVIRHGQVDTNIKNQINGWNEEILNDIGIKQAISVGEQLKNIKFDVIFCSPLLRAKQTYNYLNIKNVPTIYDDRIKERNSNSMVGTSVQLLNKDIWYDPTKNMIYEDSEGFKSIINRVTSILEEIKRDYQDKNILIVTHGDVCKAIYLYFHPDTRYIRKFEQNNCEVVAYRLGDNDE